MKKKILLPIAVLAIFAILASCINGDLTDGNINNGKAENINNDVLSDSVGPVETTIEATVREKVTQSAPPAESASAAEPSTKASVQVSAQAQEKPNSSQNEKITAERAKEIALSHAGLNKNNVRELKAEFDVERGIGVYEVEFKANGYEYDYEINAQTGAIIRSEKEIDD